MHANPDNPGLIHARAVARHVAEARGWSHHLIDEIDDAFLVLLSGHAPEDRITYSEVAQVDRLGYNVSRTAEVLEYLGWPSTSTCSSPNRPVTTCAHPATGGSTSRGKGSASP